MKKYLYIAGVASVAVIITLSLRIMIISTYISQIENSMTIWVSTFIPLVVFYIFNVQYGGLSSSLYTLCVLLLTILNSASMPLLEFTSAFSYEDVKSTANCIFINAIATAILTLIVRLGMVMIHSLTESQRGKKILCFITTGASVFTVMLMIFFGDLLSGTSLIKIGSFSFQIAIPVAILTLTQVGLAWNEGDKLRKMYFLEALLLNVFLILMGETGIPIIEFITFAFFYFLLQTKRVKMFSYVFPIAAVSGLTALGVIHALNGKLMDVPLLGGISEKVERRIFTDSVDQINMCLRSLSSGGAFGSATYTQYVPEASSDFGFATITHYSGYIAALAVLTSLCLFAVSGIYKYTKKNENNNVIEKMTFSFVCVTYFVNLLMLIGLFPVIGFQMLFTGVSKTFILLNAFSLGVLTFDREIDAKLVSKIKEAIYRC